MRINERPDLATTFKHSVGLQDPDRYTASVTEVSFCPGKASGKEWQDHSFPFNARLWRGLGVEAALRPHLPSIGFPEEAPPKMSLDGIEGHADSINAVAIADIKSTDTRDPTKPTQEYQLVQAMAYCKLYGRDRFFFITLYNRINGGLGDIYIREFHFTPGEIERNWRQLKRYKEVSDKARDWAKRAGPRTIPPEFRRPNYDWECRNCPMLIDKLCPGAY